MPEIASFQLPDSSLANIVLILEGSFSLNPALKIVLQTSPGICICFIAFSQKVTCPGMIADCSVLVVKFLFLQRFIIWDGRWQSSVKKSQRSQLWTIISEDISKYKRFHAFWYSVMIDVILRQGKQLITMNFIHLIGALPILGGGCVWKRLPGWFWTNLYMIIFLKEMRPKKGQIKNYIFERKIHSFQILFQWHLLVLRRKVSPEEEAPSVWKIKRVCLEKIFLLGTVSASFGVAIVFSLLSWTALIALEAKR